MISCIPLCGSFLGGAIVPSVYERNWSFGEAFRVGFLLCLIGFVLVSILTYIDYKTEKYDKKLLEKYSEDKRLAKIQAGIPLKDDKTMKTFK